MMSTRRPAAAAIPMTDPAMTWALAARDEDEEPPLLAVGATEGRGVG